MIHTIYQGGKDMNKAFNLKNFIISLAITLGTGALAAFLTQNSMEIYEPFIKPPLSPPGWLFPIVWTILYTLMGISAYLVYETEADQKQKDKALSLFLFQLFLNFLWSIVFFNFQNYLLAFGVLLVLWILILAMIINFNKVNPLAAKLQIPYLLWVSFAGYLNFGIYLLNR